MNWIRYNPARSVDLPFDRFFEDFFARPQPTVQPTVQGEVQAKQALLPRVDIREENVSVVLSAELPGVTEEDLNIQLENGILTVTGEKKVKQAAEKTGVQTGVQTDEEKGIYRSERVYGTFKRSFKVPETVDADQIAAKFVDGVLTLTLPKKPEASPRKIAIGRNGGEVKEITGN